MGRELWKRSAAYLGIRFEVSALTNEVKNRATTLRDPDARISSDDLVEVCSRVREDRFGSLAQRLDCPYAREDLVVPESVARDIDLALKWARHGSTVLDDWGMLGRVPNGRALDWLFSGPPGTGKTMAAQVLARELRSALYRIDLSQVVNKYIGETEKNLAWVFEAARNLNVVLFFDEADALFGKRTEVRDAHDRYANVETGFLLQCIEQHPGVTILATNIRNNLDDAFLRRIQIVADFPMPGPKERRLLWDGFLTPGVPRSPDLDLEFISNKFALSGGDIRNAVLTAAHLAAADESAVAMRHLIFGLWRELTKSGRTVLPQEFGAWAEHVPKPPTRSVSGR